MNYNPVLVGEPDTEGIESVCREMAAELKPGTLVCIENTLPVGCTRKLAGVLEEGGLKAGVEFDLVFSPERVKSQLVFEGLAQTPKIIGSICSSSAARA